MPYVNHVYFEEAGTGYPLVFLHCPALSHIYWRPTVDRLRSHFRCVSLDIRGHGRSGDGDTPWTFGNIAGDVKLLVQHLGLDRPVLVGYSSGGTIALQAAVDDPDLYGGLVVVSGLSECSTLHMHAKISAGLLASKFGFTSRVGVNITGTNNAGPEHRQALLPDAKAVRPRALRSFLTETRRVHLTPQLGRIKVPTLLVYGATDHWMQGYARILQRGIPQARLVFFPKTDHRVPTRKPEQFAKTLADFAAQFVDTQAQGHHPVASAGLEHFESV